MNDHRLLAVLRRAPLTIGMLALLLVIGVVTTALWVPASSQDWYEQVAYGLPAFEAGRWWTIATGTMVAAEPSHYVPVVILIAGGLGWAEYALGTGRAAVVFVVGQIVAVVGAAAILAALRPTGWDWAVELATQLDVGPSGGAFACAAAATVTLRAPWRLRARLLIWAWVGIAAVYIGALPDLEHLVGAGAALTVMPLLPRYRHRRGRPSEREWRLVAFSGLVMIAVVQIIVHLVSISGPLGVSEATPALWGDLLIDLAIIALIANGVRRGVRIAWWIAVVLAALNQLQLILVVLLLVLVSAEPGTSFDGVPFIVAGSLLWLAELVVLVAGRGAFRVRLRRRRRHLGGVRHDDAEESRRLLQADGGGVISWMATWPGNEYLLQRPTPDGPADAIVAFQRHAGVAIALGDPLGLPEHAGQALQAFIAESQRSGLTPCAFSVSEHARESAPAGWRSLRVAEDTIIDLPELALTGKRWQNVRAAINRAEREGITFRLCRLADEPWAVLAQVRAISEQWVGDKGLPEMKFTLGGVDEALDPAVRVGLALDADGSVHGVTSWLPVHGPGGAVVGWTLDLMRRRDGSFGPVMEYLIASSALAFKEEGALFASLSGAPLVNTTDAEPGPIDRVLGMIATTLEPLYGFRSLHQFKAKFNPRSEPLYLLYRDEGDLPRIGIALTKAYLPDATLRELVRAPGR